MDILKFLKDHFLEVSVVTYLCLILVYFGYMLLKSRNIVMNFCQNLGASHIGDRLMFYPIHVLSYDGRTFEIYLGRVLYSKVCDLNFQTKLHVRGFLYIWKPDPIERVFFRERKGGLGFKFDDKDWAFRIIEDHHMWGKIEALFNEFSISFIEINGNKATVGWYLGKMNRIQEKLNELSSEDKIFAALQIINEFTDRVNGIGSSKVYAEDLRVFFSIKLPIALAIFFTLSGIFLDSFKYYPVCLNELFFRGYQLFLPVLLLYSIVLTVILGKGNLGAWFFLKTIFACILCTFPIILFYLPYLNGKLDKTEPIIYRDKIKRKFEVPRGSRYRVTLEKYEKCGYWQRSFKVSKEFYDMSSVGDTVEFALKRGYFGIKWYHQRLTLVKENVGYRFM